MLKCNAFFSRLLKTVTQSLVDANAIPHLEYEVQFATLKMVQILDRSVYRLDAQVSASLRRRCFNSRDVCYTVLIRH